MAGRRHQQEPLDMKNPGPADAEFGVDMQVDLCGLRLKNPIMPASGCFGFGREYGRLYDLSQLGAVVVKATTLAPRLGNPTPRVTETPAGMLNAIGLQNPGVDWVISHELPWLRQFQLPVIVNVAGSTEEEYMQVSRRLSQCGLADAIELNVSCPNVKHGGITFGTSAAVLGELVRKVRQVVDIPLLVKLSPNVTNIVEMAKAAEDAGADGLTLINTLLGMAIDLRTQRPVLANVTGGLSGPAIKPVAVRMVYEVSQAVGIPVVGVGGIASGSDAAEFILAGAAAVQVGTANFTDPYACLRIIRELEQYCLSVKVSRVRDLQGLAWRSKEGEAVR